jgi:colanic acid/amylovoran biosynthesis protein
LRGEHDRGRARRLYCPPSVARARRLAVNERIVTIGAAYSANKGAGSMLQALFDRVPERRRDVTFTVLSTYPVGDRESLRWAREESVRVADGRPIRLLLDLLPTAAVAGALRRARLPWRWVCFSDATRALAEADLIVDVSGISFSDSRAIKFNVYSLLSSLPGIFLGIPQVKCSQAIGPFHGRVNRAFARFVLPRLRAVTARGETTAAHLRALGQPFIEADDLAFLMRRTEVSAARIDGLLAAAGLDDRPVGVAPSAVVRGFCEGNGIDYVGAMAALIDGLTIGGHSVILFAHSTSARPLPRRLDDVPVCRAVADRLTHPSGCLVIEDDLLPADLRELIARCTVLVTSRFHAMISALAVGTPPLVIGWSHKYAEVLDQFGLAEAVVGFEHLGAARLQERCRDMVDRRDELAALVTTRLPATIRSAERNLDQIARALGA